MYTSKDGVLLVVGGFYIPFIVRRNGCKGFIPLRGALILSVNLMALSMKAWWFVHYTLYIRFTSSE